MRNGRTGAEKDNNKLRLTYIGTLNEYKRPRWGFEYSKQIKIDPFPYGTLNGVIVASLREKRWSSKLRLTYTRTFYEYMRPTGLKYGKQFRNLAPGAAGVALAAERRRSSLSTYPADKTWLDRSGSDER